MAVIHRYVIVRQNNREQYMSRKLRDSHSNFKDLGKSRFSSTSANFHDRVLHFTHRSVSVGMRASVTIAPALLHLPYLGFSSSFCDFLLELFRKWCLSLILLLTFLSCIFLSFVVPSFFSPNASKSSRYSFEPIPMLITFAVWLQRCCRCSLVSLKQAALLLAHIIFNIAFLSHLLLALSM